MFKKTLRDLILLATLLFTAACVPALRQLDSGDGLAGTPSAPRADAKETSEPAPHGPVFTPASAPAGDKAFGDRIRGGNPASSAVTDDGGGDIGRDKVKKGSTEEWEDNKIQRLATDMARRFPNVWKAKVCLDARNDEWWVILYEDNDTFVELKQFVWNRDEERMEPHLVQRRVPKSKLEEELASSPKDRGCWVLDGLAKE